MSDNSPIIVEIEGKKVNVTSLIGQVSKQKKQIAKLTQENESLVQRLNKASSPTSVAFRDGKVVLTKTIRDSSGDTGLNQKLRSVDPGVTDLMTAVYPILDLVRAAAKAQDVYKRPESHLLDEDGKPDPNQLEKDGDKQIFLPSILDKAIARMNFLVSLPAFEEYMSQLQEKLSNPKEVSILNDKAKSIANTEKEYERPKV